MPNPAPTVVAGTDEMHLDLVIDRVRRELNDATSIGPPQVAYLETITRPVEVDFTHKEAVSAAQASSPASSCVSSPSL